MDKTSINKKVLVTGATGYVGQNLVKSLIKKGHKIYVLTRNESSIFSNDNSVNVIIGDITDSITLPPDIDTIYHCAGVIYNPKEMKRVNILGTKNIVEIAIKNNCKLIYLSSAGIIGNSKDNILDENTVCHPQNAYEISKYKAEQIVLDAIKKGLHTHILRPTTIFGFKKDPKNDSFLGLVKAMRNGSYRNIDQGIYNIVHIDEVVRAMEMLDEESTSYGEIYLVNNSIKYKDMDIIVKNLSPKVVKNTQAIPYPIAFIATIILTVIYSITNKKSPLTNSRLRALTNKSTYSQNKLEKTVHFKNTLAIEEYIKRVCEEYIERGLLS